MRTMGIVRRIDDLGRIVIPKEIRKRLHMDNGDFVDIGIEDNNVILSKFFPFHQEQNFIQSLCESLKESFQIDFIVTDTKKIIYSTLNHQLNNEYLEEDFLKRIPALLEKEISSLNHLNLTKSYRIDQESICYQIQIEEQCFGYLILLDKMISKKQKDLAQFILNYFSKVLK